MTLTSASDETDRHAKNSVFPRGGDLPFSPTWFSLNKDRFLRQLLIEDIEAVTGRRLLVFFSNPDQRPAIEAKDQEGFTEILSDINGIDEFDLLIESSGGDTDTADSIISLLQQIGTFRALVPGVAKSNATLIALASETLVMGPASEIGPIEPRIDSIPATFWAQNKFRDSEDINISILYKTAEDALNHTAGIATNLLSNGMMKDKTEAINDTVELLCAYTDENLQNGKKREFYSHGATINAEKATELGLNVTKLKSSDRLEILLRFLHAMYARDCRVLGYSKVFETRRVSNQYKLKAKSA